ncbi:Imm26 family immunity protein [Lihuaxuella thermophila]|uniref:Immunity protein 26 n=1 Tax=Lihuaxuella thermophila TaxID=1173111 RepID=A0A1H8H737_9BACL|nr:Imm26 family immunity protein [Lihuaxuella thermophila]SEN51819.1 Immunity protein 26 [Lihuaxuella thermophila]
MGFWEETTKENNRLLIGDEPFDILIDAFQELSNVYLEDAGRKPTSEELGKLIALALDSMNFECLSDMEGFTLSECKIKKKKVKKIKYKPGDLFAIPLNDGEVYGYGMVCTGGKPMEDVYIEYYNIFTDNIISINQFKRLKKEVVFTLLSGVAGILDNEWKKIGSIPFDESKYQIPDFYDKMHGDVYYISKGAANNPDARIFPVTKEEALKVKNPDGLIGSGIIEEWLYEEYLKQKTGES